MSGVCAVVTFDGTDVPQRLLLAMAEQARHRAPDGVTTWLGPGAAFAHLALHVTPHDHARKQPVVSRDLVCIADARIDNRDELLPQLRNGRRDIDGDQSDAELVLAAFRKWSTGSASRLIGDFAFVIWDRRRRRLFAARDAMGARNLYYRVEPGRRVLIATEIPQLLAAPRVPREPNEAALVADIAGLSALPAMTAYAGIDQLPPAHLLRVDAHSHRTRRYWDIDPDHRIRYRYERDYAEHLRALLTRSVRDRLRTGRPVGVFLSGGLDSTAIAATSARLLDKTSVPAPSLKAFSWAFDELPDDDERHRSRILVEAYDLDVTDVDGDDAWPLSGFPEHGPHEDDPFVWPYQRLIERTLSRARARDVRVMMTSDRGDEMVGNWVYDELGLLLAGRWSAFNEDRRKLQARNISAREFILGRIVRPLVTTVWHPDRLPALRSRLGQKRKPSPPWVNQAAARRVGLDDIRDAATRLPPIHGYARLQRYTSVFNIVSLRIAELRHRTSARSGLEYADPWGDRRIAEFVCAIPQFHLHRRSCEKHLTREAMRGILPDVLRRDPVRSPPVGLYRRAFHEREVGTVRRLFSDSKAETAGWLDASAVLDNFESQLRGEYPQDEFWHPLTVELWLRRWWD